MSKTEWFRRTSWTDADRENFNARLKRSRGAGMKAQYLRIQAQHLADAGHDAAAIELLDRMLAEFPQRTELAQAHSQRAKSLANLGRTAAAVLEYRAAVQAERDFPNVRTNAWLDFGWLAVERQLTECYDEVTCVLREFRDEDHAVFPATEYRYAVIQALLADHRGDKAQARAFAQQALAESAKDHSGFRYHPTVGLVGAEQNTFASRLKVLAEN